MSAPVPLPPQSPSTAHHSAAQIATDRRNTPCGGAVAACRAVRPALHSRAGNKHVPLAAPAGGTPYQPYKRVTRGLGACSGARLTIPARTVRLARSDAGEPDTRAFCAPYRPVTVPDAGRRAGERLACGDDGSGKEEEERHALYGSRTRPLTARAAAGVTFHCGAAASTCIG
jgi:hypothetical protein